MYHMPANCPYDLGILVYTAYRCNFSLGAVRRSAARLSLCSPPCLFKFPYISLTHFPR